MDRGQRKGDVEGLASVGDGGQYICLGYKEPNDGAWGEWPMRQRWADMHDCRRQLKGFIAAHADHDIYWKVNGFTCENSVEDNAVAGWYLVADMDATDPRKVSPKPTMAWSTSAGRYQALLRVTGASRDQLRDLNERLLHQYELEEREGFSLTKFLRIPGSVNNKYGDGQQGSILWTDGPTYTADQLERMLPAVRNSRHHRHMRKSRHLANGRDRSGRHVTLPFDKDIRVQEVIDDFWDQLHLRWHGKEAKGPCPNCGEGDDRLHINPETELWGCRQCGGGGVGGLALVAFINGYAKRNAPAKKHGDDIDPDDIMAPMSMAQVTKKKPVYMTPFMVARGMVTMIGAHQGAGKSRLIRALSKIWLDGDTDIPMPEGVQWRPRPLIVLAFDVENSAEYLVKQQLEDQGCKNLHNYHQEERSFSIENEYDCNRVHEVMTRIGPDIVVFDVKNKFVMSDINHPNQSAAAGNWFKRLAGDYGCAVVLLEHLTKGARDSAVLKNQGNAGAGGDIHLQVWRMGDETIVVVVKHRLDTRAYGYAWAYTVEADGQTDKVVWQRFTTADPDELAAPQYDRMGGRMGEKENRDADAQKFVQSVIAEHGGCVSLDKLKERGAKHRPFIGPKRIRDAIKAIGADTSGGHRGQHQTVRMATGSHA